MKIRALVAAPSFFQSALARMPANYASPFSKYSIYDLNARNMILENKDKKDFIIKTA
jgi:hypothetical protein